MLHVFMIFNIIFDGVSVPYFYGIMVDCLFVCWNSLFCVCLFVCFFISLFICLFVYLFICLFVEKKFLTFEQITLVPIQTKLILPGLLTDQETDWLNNYHQTCRDRYIYQIPDMQGQVHISDTRHAGTGTYIRYQTCRDWYIYQIPDMQGQVHILDTIHAETGTYIRYQTCRDRYIY